MDLRPAVRVTSVRLLAVWVLILSAISFGADATLPSSRITPQHKQQYADLAVTWMQDYLRIDTTNPPGNEMKTIGFLKKILDQEGIENRVFEYTPGRGDLGRVFRAAPPPRNGRSFC